MTMIDMRDEATRTYVQMVTLAQGLAFEVNVPGMRFTRATALLPVAKRLGYKGKQRKIDALRWVVQTLEDAVPTWEPSPTILRALDSE